MGAEFIHSCNNCGFSVITSGPWEFYRDHEGKRKPYGHLITTSEEVRERGIYGLAGRLYCPQCAKTYNVILVEFKKPFQGDGSIWLGRKESGECEPKEEYKDNNAVKCPKCVNTRMILEPDDEQEILCPKCKLDYLKGTMEWVAECSEYPNQYCPPF